MNKEKDESFHFRLTKTKHTSLKELSDQLDRIEHGLEFLLRNTFKDARLVQGVWRRYSKKKLPRIAGFSAAPAEPGGPK